MVTAIGLEISLLLLLLLLLGSEVCLEEVEDNCDDVTQLGSVPPLQC